MESIQSITQLIRLNCFMASIDLQDAYYSMKIKEADKRYLKLQSGEQIFKFTCLPNGLSIGPRKFTKLLKPPLAALRKLGHMVCFFIDDLINIGDSYEACVINVLDTISIMHSVGFVVHPEKSSLIPKQQIVFLGFVIESTTMTLTLTPERKRKIIKGCETLLNDKKLNIRRVARVIGMLTSSFPAVKYGPLYFRALEHCKSLAVKRHKGNYNATMTISEKGNEELRWWKANVGSAYNHIYHGTPSVTLTTDASRAGWGAIIKEEKTQGLWNEREKSMHINVLELKAILFGLQALVKDSDCHMQILWDNTTAVQTVKKMGTSHSTNCSKIVKKIWEFAAHRNIWISATHIPGKLYFEADEESRNLSNFTEWMLNPAIFQQVIKKFRQNPVIDLFASRLNYQIKPFISYRPDPEAISVNAFQISWKEIFFYAFPPFGIVGKVLQKVIFEQAEGILIVPDWPYQPWFSRLTTMLVTKHFTLCHDRNLLIQPNQKNAVHPLHKTLNLQASHISGKNWQCHQRYQSKLSRS